MVDDDGLGYYDDGEEHLFDESYKEKLKAARAAVSALPLLLLLTSLPSLLLCHYRHYYHQAYIPPRPEYHRSAF